MAISPHVTVHIDFARIRRNAETIIQQTGVALIAVVKADAYGLGANAVARAIADLIDAFYVFDFAESIAANLRDVGKRRVICLMGSSNDPADYLAQDIRPVVWTEARAAALKKAKPILSLDTGQQRFGCALENVGAILDAGDCQEMMTHATRLEQVVQLREVAGAQHRSTLRLHAAGSNLLDRPEAWLDAVRPGMALYRGAAVVSTHLVDVRDSTGPAGYTHFRVPRFGLILAGYSNGLRPGPCLVNGQRRRILEVGMQSSFVEISGADRLGDSVVLMNQELDADAIAQDWGVRPPEALLRMTGLGNRIYSE